MIQRERLLALFRAYAPPLTIIAAPSGYGKSVLAAQFARSAGFATSVWADLHEQDVTDDAATLELASAILQLRAGPRDGSSDRLPEPGTAWAEARLILEHGFARLRGKPICVVLDAGGTVTDAVALQRTADLIVEHTCARSRLVVACRQVSMPEQDPSRIWVIDHTDLRFKHHEIEALVDVCGQSGIADSDSILARSGGQPALVSLMIRHPAAVTEQDEAQDLVWYTDHLLSKLDDDSFKLLYCATLLGEDTIEHLAAALGHDSDALDWISVTNAMPLFSVSAPGPMGLCRFNVHAALARAVCAQAESRMPPERVRTLRSCTLALLHAIPDYGRLVRALLTQGNEAESAEWCDRAGEGMLRAVGPQAMQRCLQQVPMTAVAASPRLMLLSATVLRQMERFSDALRTATSAQRLAAHLGDADTDTSASLLAARLALDTGDLSRTRAALAHLEPSRDSRLTSTQECLTQAYLAVTESYKGRITAAQERTARVRELLPLLDVGSDEAVYAVNGICCVDGACGGSWSVVAGVIGAVAERADLSPVQRLLMRANHAAALLENGCLDDAWALTSDVVREAEKAELRQLHAYAMSTQSCILYSRGETARARECLQAATTTLAAFGDKAGLGTGCVEAALGERAAGDHARSLALAERAVGALDCEDEALSLLAASARIEMAASLLAMGDQRGSASMISDVMSGMSEQAYAHCLRADLILAEIDRRRGQSREAVHRLQRHASYVVTGSANYQAAMYARAFPEMLAMLAAAVGVDKLPARLLAMLPSDTLALASQAALALMPTQDAEDFRERLAGFADPAAPVESRSDDADPPEDGGTTGSHIYVRVLGGLEAITPSGEVDGSVWRKRKARLLFAMLVLHRGRDVSRDVILERLWPDMDYDHARNNFYVMWSAVKRALSCGAEPDSAECYVQNSGGLCRVTSFVRSDLDDFYAAVDGIRSGIDAGSLAAVVAEARTLMDLYRGDVLPGDVYEDWINEVRTQVKQDFCDAMLRAARCCDTSGEHDIAVQFARRAVAADPWREDTYQVLMRSHLGAGQRSRAIEAYLACRTRLVEDLGIDPCSDTTEIYQAVLAMEDGQPDYRSARS